MKNLKKYKKEIGQRIKLQRAALGYTQEALAQKLDIKRSSLASIEIGQNSPTIETVITLADLFNVSADWILTGKATSIDIEKIENTEDKEFIRNFMFQLIHSDKLLNTLKEEFDCNIHFFGKKIK